LITAVRDLVGPQTLIVGTLDLHAHVTAAMVAGADALLIIRKIQNAVRMTF
ncbi:MAG: hypothetical protein COA98_05815, partial [Candidatus Neomarinimicrobiota bacterium]